MCNYMNKHVGADTHTHTDTHTHVQPDSTNVKVFQANSEIKKGCPVASVVVAVVVAIVVAVVVVVDVTKYLRKQKAEKLK